MCSLTKTQQNPFLHRQTSDIITIIKDAEFVSETVLINRLYHRELIARMPQIEELEKKWNCKVEFPSTEMASDTVTISGPEYQVPQALDDFLVGLPDPNFIYFSHVDY